MEQSRFVQNLPASDVEDVVRRALREDIGTGDATTLSTVPGSTLTRAEMVAREPLVVAGLPLAIETFRQVSAGTQIEAGLADGAYAAAGSVLLRARGAAQALLTAERVALNFMQRLSGIATLTHQFVEEIRGTRAQILDTRKTTPGLRLFEKYAVVCGGGRNHRFGLFDRILIKDNHLVALRDEAPNPIAAAVQRARAAYPQLQIEVEADHLDQVVQALEAGADQVLLDNMDLEQLRAAVKRVAGRIPTEASGGVNLSNVRAIAETGVDFISVGALTHSAPAVDIAFDFEHDA